MTYLSLFTGIGMIDYGLDLAGFHCVGQVEISPYCRSQLHKHWPDVPRIADVHSVRTDSFPVPDLIAGGFPCQPVSCAGKRGGQNDPRWLWPEFHRIIRDYRPDWVLAENVPGLRTLGYDLVAANLEAEDYSVWPLLVGAQHAGSPHRRKRVWIVARRRPVVHADSERHAREVFTEAEKAQKEIDRRIIPVRSVLPPWPPRPSQVSEIPFALDGNARHVAGWTEAIRSVGNGAIWIIPYLVGTWIMTVHHERTCDASAG